ncbi:hemolysin family protein [Garciella nitratireducens]|uniref:hemolysin family protein n=1 Tax=Garciella nitratireducens TaxID=218205 RepID=UPI001BD45F4D|nr:hemolysin family protein [Garciella nitratireducens]
MSEDSIGWRLILQFILIAINAVFACAEIAVLSSNENKIDAMSKEGNKRAKRLLTLIEEPSRFLSTIQVGITFAGFLASAFAADHFSSILVDWFLKIGVALNPVALNSIVVIIITIILSFFTLIFGELVPKRIAMKNPDKISLVISGWICWISKIFSPIVWILTQSTNAILHLIGIDPHEELEEVTEEDIRMMVDQGSEKGSINPTEKQMIHNIFEFDNKEAEDVMTHRTDVDLLWLEDSDEEWEKTIYESRHTYYPICHESTDNIVGVLNTKDYFRLKDKSRKNVLEKAVKPAYFVPETVRTDILFYNMKTSRNHFAVVMDEYGGMTGIITMSDLLEQLVGDLDDDDSLPVEPPFIQQIDSNTWKIQGCTPLKLIKEQLGIEFPDNEDYDTFGGFVFGILGTIPKDGSTPELEILGLHIQVLKIKDHRLENAIVQLLPETDEENKKQENKRKEEE